MKKIVSILTALMIVLQISSVAVVNAQNKDEDYDSLGQLGSDIAGKGIEEAIDFAGGLIEPGCALYAVWTDFVNYPGERWSFLWSVLDITVLFRNQSWRDLIWAIDDKREEIRDQLVKDKQQLCILESSTMKIEADKAGKDAVGAKTEDISNQTGGMRRQVMALEKKIAENDMKLKYYSSKRWEVFSDRPFFKDETKAVEGEFSPAVPLDTSKVFYILGYDIFSTVNWDQFGTEANNFAKRTWGSGTGNWGDLGLLYSNIPDTGCALANLADDVYDYYAYKLSTGEKYENFGEFIEAEQDGIIKKTCKKDSSIKTAKADKSKAELQYEELLKSLNLGIKNASTALSKVESEITTVEDVLADLPIEAAAWKTNLENSILPGMNSWRGYLLGKIDYNSLVISKVGSSASKSLTALTDSIQNFVEAILGVTSENGESKSRLSMQERFQKRRAKQLQKICSRIEDMYRQSGRSTADLPIIGSVEGKVYCKAKPDCADVGLDDIAGASSGSKSLAECSGFTFDSSETGPSQLQKDAIEFVGDDIGSLLEQSSYNDLLKARNLHFESLRNRYKGVYGTQGGTTNILDDILTDISSDLYPDGEHIKAIAYDVSDGNKEPGTHYSYLRRLYLNFWNFANQQKGSCAAPKEPPKD